MPRPAQALAPAPASPLRRRPSPAAGAILALSAATACVRDKGEVELNWTVVDAAGRSIFPAGELGDVCNLDADKFDDLCGFIGSTTPDGPRRPYRLRTQLRLCEPDCPQACTADESCQIDVRTYGCKAARGFSIVDARADEPYDFEVALVAEFEDDGCVCELGPACALTPGPRTRTVEPGLLTDLQVYLFVLTGLDACAQEPSEQGRTVMDLQGCCDGCS
ncbi:hypothetical protein SAMN02745121_06904 [Nannocystis exedens]|uniref:Uncharacterized protein n=1 Tax=Nannocystis exedens TaxID=54 RepID=A0A1I2FXE3_9BACT|nr:hypothetical protein [Nannocystis exedens]PCC74539.1 hypothetical protein NAEX_07635 [Nannocystis exedens]SFF10045.1 hypothetical protein SAMN02745121_06904 [Nannocystis exedens]